MAEGFIIRAEIPASIGARSLTAAGFVFRVQRGSNTPRAAVLLPMIEDDRKRYCLEVDGRPVCKPSANDVKPVPVKIADAKPFNGFFSLPALPWPGSAERALLLVFYESAWDVGRTTDSVTETQDGRTEPEQLAPATPVPSNELGKYRKAVEQFFVFESQGIAADRPGLIYPGFSYPAIWGIPAKDAAYTFALASCQYPGGLLDCSLRPGAASAFSTGLSDRSLFALSTVESEVRPDLLIIAGDQVYVDATAGLFDPKVMDDGLRAAYRALHGNMGYSAIFNHPMTRLAVIDDHEIEDDWEPLPNEPRHRARPLYHELQCGGEAYVREVRRWQHCGHIDHDYELCEPLHFTFQSGGHEFFMADTRTRREGRDAGNLLDATIMDDEQWSLLAKWIKRRDDGVPAFVITPSILLPRLLSVARGWPMAALHSDSWDGYPSSLCAMLALLCDNRRRNIVFLSGDVHISLATRIDVQRLDESGASATIYSVHSSALYAPYPFANCIPEDFARAESFDFEWPFVEMDRFRPPRKYRCTVRTFFPEIRGKPVGDGFALLTTKKTDTGWIVDVSFRGARGEAPCELFLS